MGNRSADLDELPRNGIAKETNVNLLRAGVDVSWGGELLSPNVCECGGLDERAGWSQEWTVQETTTAAISRLFERRCV